jgi:hypothetical protein
MNDMPAAYRSGAGYVIDLHARFKVLSKGRKLQRLTAIEPFKAKAGKRASTTCQGPRGAEWNASANLTRFMPDLLLFQIGHYAASQKQDRHADIYGMTAQE